MADVIGPAPVGFGLRWRDCGIKQTRFGARRLSKAEPTPSFRGAWMDPGTCVHLRAWGYSLSPAGWDGGMPDALHWGDGVERDMAFLPEFERLGVRVWEQAEAKRVAEEARVQVLRDGLRETVDTRAWAMSPQARAKAQKLLGWRTWTEKEQGDALALTMRAAFAVEEAGAKVEAAAKAALAADVETCSDDAVRADVLAGCRWVTSADEDRATDANREGWCRVSSRAGHWLSLRPDLDQGQAAVGLALLRRFRSQLPPDLAGRLGFAAARVARP